MSTIPTQIRDAALARIAPLTVGGAAFKATRKAPITKVQIEQLPACAVFIAAAHEDQRGDVTLPQFTESLTLGISVLMSATDPVFEEGALDQFVADAKNALLTDPSFLALFEYVTATSRDYRFEHVAESYIVELRLRLTVTYYTEYSPQTPNPFTQMVVTAQPEGFASSDAFEQQILVPGG